MSDLDTSTAAVERLCAEASDEAENDVRGMRRDLALAAMRAEQFIDVADLERWAATIDRQVSALRALAAERDQFAINVDHLIAAARVPGAWVCDTCGFRLQKMILRACDGAVGVSRDAVTDICQNDGTSLRPLTWKEDAESSVGIEYMKRAEAAEARIVELEAR
jgi:hypothetical protein